MPNSDEKLSALGFGCMRLPSKTGGATVDKAAATRQVRLAIDSGANYLDTAYLYPGSEAFLGECLKDGYRERVNIATKLPCAIIGKRETMDEIFETDFKRMVDEYDWEFAQVQFNFLDENYQAGLDGIQYAHEKGLGIIIMEPLRGGSLTTRIPKDAQSVYDNAPVKRSPAEWGLRWVWNHPEVTVVLSGMNDDENVKENLKTAEDALPNSMSEKELEVLERVKDCYHFRNACTGCSYCMPCPAGINIPSAFSFWNKDGMEGGGNGYQAVYERKMKGFLK